MQINFRPSVSGSRKADGYKHQKDGDHRWNGKEGAKNPRSLNKGHRYHKNMKLCIGTQNIRTLREQDRITELEKELETINWDIIGLSETKRKGETYVTLNSGNILLNKGKDDDSSNGVGFIIRKVHQHRIQNFTAISDRIAYIIFQINKSSVLKLIQIYAPTTAHEEQEIDEFYDQLRIALDEPTKGKKQYIMIMGDFNAKLGVEKMEDEYCGKHGLGHRNERGDRLVEFLNENQLYAMNTFFKKKPNRRWTWISPNGQVKNEIDFILSKNKNIIHDVSTLNHFDVGSDHRLLRAKVIIKTKIERQKGFKKKNTEIRIQDIVNKKEEYQQAVESKLTDIEKLNNNNTIETMHKEILNAISHGTKITKKRNDKNKSSNLNEIQQLLKERRQLISENKRITTEYTDLCKTIRRKIKENRIKKQEEKINTIIEQNGAMKVLRPRLGKKQIYALRNNNGDVIRDKKEILRIVEEFYEKLYESKVVMNANDQQIHKETPKIQNVGSEELPDIEEYELENALEQMKTNKSPGKDGIMIELIKWGGKKLKHKVLNMLNKCLIQANIPEDWNDSIVILLHKKGDHTRLENYRPISLLSVLYKLMTKIITNRLTIKLDAYQSETQAGFRKGYGTRDHLFTMKLLIEKTNEYNIPLYLAFIDFEKAFDSVETWAVMEALRNCRIDNRYIDLLNNISNKTTATYKLHEETKPVQLKRGVRQGDCLSPKLFTLALEDIFRKLHWDNYGVNINGKKLNHLRYADDIIIIATNRNDLEYMVKDLKEQAEKIGLKMNLSKTKTMMPEQQDVAEALQLENVTIENVDEYIYLGQILKLSRDSQITEIKRRCRLSWVAFGKLGFILNSRNIAQHLKTKVFDKCILPVMTYGSENWTLTKTHLNKLKVTQRAMERRMLGISLLDKKPNTWIRARTRLPDVVERIANLKWSWAGHLARTQEDKWTKTILQWRPWEYKRNRGRPPNRWYNDIKTVAGLGWIRTAQNRDNWKLMKEAFVQLWTETG